MSPPCVRACLAAALLTTVLAARADVTARALPPPLPAHPGNVFLAGESVSVPMPAQGAAPWRVTDYEGRQVARGQVPQGRAVLGKLPVGFYELAWGNGAGSNHVSLGVLEPLRAPTPLTSPIGIDVAMAWFFHK